MEIKIAKEYSKTPGARYVQDGPFSGEDFRDTILEKKYLECLNKKEKLTIDFDGGYGYGTSFLEESFGGLVRKGNDGKKILETMIFISKEEPDLINKVKKYIEDAINLNDK